MHKDPLAHYDHDHEYDTYRKPAPKKKVKRAKHKHQYSNCLIKATHDKYGFINHWHRGEYCTICGRIKNVYIFDDPITDKELKSLPKFEVESYVERYVTLQINE